jgi:hypothetical protein
MSQSTTTIIEKRELQRLRGFEYKYSKLLAFSLKNRLKLKKIIDTNIYAGLLTELESVLNSIDELKDKPETRRSEKASDSSSDDDYSYDTRTKQDKTTPKARKEQVHQNVESESEESEREELKPIDFSNDDWKTRKSICILPYNKEPSGTVEYYGDGNDFYVDELKRTYKNIVFPVGRVSTRRYKLHCDVFLNKGFPKWMYYADSKHKVIGVEKVCYSDEDDDPDSNTPVNDLRDEFITHYLF